MEHSIILLIEAIIALDRKLQKPLARIVPDYGRLRAAPREYLAEEPLVIGPRRPYAVATVLGLVVGIGVLVVFGIAAMERPRNQAVGGGYVLAAGLAGIVSWIATTMLLLHWLRGGSAVVRPQGVEFVYRGRRLFCPWTLFQVTGAPYQPDHRRLILPVNDQVVLAECNGADEVLARPASEIRMRSLAACADGQMTLADLYEARLSDVGQLLLDLGARLGDGVIPSDPTQPVSAVPLATVEKDGWLRIRLTRLPFPPLCCSCGAATVEVITLPLDARNTARIDVPLCRACQVTRTRRRLRALLWGLGLGFAPAAIWAAVAGAIFRPIELVLGFALFVPLGLVLGVVVGIVLRDRSEPVRFRDYSIAKGTVAMRVAPSLGAPIFLESLGVVTAPETAEGGRP